MRILHWTESFWPRIGGAEILARALIEETRRRGYECAVVSDVAGGLPTEDVVDHVPVRRFPFQAALASRDIRGVAKLAAQSAALVRNVAPDVIHLHTSQPGAFFFLRARHALRTPSVFTTHDPLGVAGPGTSLLAELFGAVQTIAAVSSFMAGQIAAAFPETRPRVHLVRSGLPWPARHPSPLPWHPPSILAAGRLTEAKGFDVLVKAMPVVRRARPDVSLVVAGNGPCHEHLADLAHTLGVDGCVRFTGWVPSAEIVDLIDQATVVAVPSRWDEPFGLVALEAMQMARPVVASQVGGLPELVTHERTGRLVPPGDADALAEALRVVLSDRETASAMGRQGQHAARTTFDWTRCVDGYEALYLEATR